MRRTAHGRPATRLPLSSRLRSCPGRSDQVRRAKVWAKLSRTRQEARASAEVGRTRAFGSFHFGSSHTETSFTLRVSNVGFLHALDQFHQTARVGTTLSGEIRYHSVLQRHVDTSQLPQTLGFDICNVSEIMRRHPETPSNSSKIKMHEPSVCNDQDSRAAKT